MTVFTKINTNYTNIYYNSIATGDFDSDRDIDLLIAGTDNDFNPVSLIYINDGTGKLSQNAEVEFPNIYYSIIATEDFDNDRDLDLLVLEYDRAENRNIKIYNNDGVGNFSQDTEAVFDNVYYSFITTGDFDDDGETDLLFIEDANDGNSIIKIYNNDGVGNFTADTKTQLDNVSVYRITSEDFDSDGDLDLLLTGFDNRENPVSAIYTNDGMGRFSEKTEANLPNFIGDSIAEDFDGDGDLDLLVTGFDNRYNRISAIYTNDGTGRFSEKIDANLSDFISSNLMIFVGEPIAGDFDGDGNFDLMFTEYNNRENNIVKIYTNDGTGSFSEDIETNFLVAIRERLIVDDFNGDSILDLSIARLDDTRNTSLEIYRNDTVKYSGDDTLVGTITDDLLNSGAGNDVIYAREGNDTIIGSDGSDRIHGQSSNDVINGGAGDDTLFGGNQFDRLDGGDGDDYLDGFNGITVYTGGSGSDLFVLNNDTYIDWVRDFELDVDTIGLTDEITFEQLEITGNINSFIAINGNRIGILLGVNPRELNASNFSEL